MDMEKNVPLSRYTTFKTGGAARFFAAPSSEEELDEALAFGRREGLECLILGRGSNLLVSDQGFQGLVVFTGQMNEIRWDGDRVIADCGVRLPELAAGAVDRGFGGLEWAVGIPGSLGGAVVMNAGAYGGEMANAVVSTLCRDGTKTLTITEHDFAYRHSVYLDHPHRILLRATLRLSPGDPDELRQTAARNREARRTKQPVNLPSAGSFFKRPPGGYAAALIDQCGLGGLRVGGAAVSDLHKGFLVNLGGATTADILELARSVRETVFRRFAVILEPEVRLVGEEWNF